MALSLLAAFLFVGLGFVAFEGEARAAYFNKLLVYGSMAIGTILIGLLVAMLMTSTVLWPFTTTAALDYLRPMLHQTGFKVAVMLFCIGLGPSLP